MREIIAISEKEFGKRLKSATILQPNELIFCIICPIDSLDEKSLNKGFCTGKKYLINMKITIKIKGIAIRKMFRYFNFNILFELINTITDKTMR